MHWIAPAETGIATHLLDSTLHHHLAARTLIKFGQDADVYAEAVQSLAPAAVVAAGAIASWGLALSAAGRTGSPLMITRPPPGLTAVRVALDAIGSVIAADAAKDGGEAGPARLT